MNKRQTSFHERPRTYAMGVILWFVFCSSSVSQPAMTWSQLPPLPDKEGFAGMYAGVSGDALIIAGGANFPDKRPWEGGTKVWYDTVWMLASPQSDWKAIGRLPNPLGYGVSVTVGNELICMGGSSADGHHAECFALSQKDGRLHTRPLPPLPEPCANMCGALVGSTVYVAGGIRKADSVIAKATFWSLDLTQSEAKWQTLATWPGKERMLAVSGAEGEYFYLFSGAAIRADKDGKPEREWLKDAYRYRVKTGWEKLPDMPRVAVAAPSPAPVLGGHSVIIASGDDGSSFGFKPETAHPGFPKNALIYDSQANQWQEGGLIPFSRATVPTVRWQGRFIVPNGEARPGYRTNEVWSLQSD